MFLLEAPFALTQIFVTTENNFVEIGLALPSKRGNTETFGIGSLERISLTTEKSK